MGSSVIKGVSDSHFTLNTSNPYQPVQPIQAVQAPVFAPQIGRGSTNRTNENNTKEISQWIDPNQRSQAKER